MTSLRKNPTDLTKSAAYPPNYAVSRCSDMKYCFRSPVKTVGIFVVSLMGFIFLFSAFEGRPFYGLRTQDLKPWKKDVDLDDIIKQNSIMGDYFRRPVEKPEDELLGGLLPAGFDENSCVSRHQWVLYRKGQKHQPSPYLISRLRKYESLHKRCGPFTESYNRTVEFLKSGGQHTNSTGCKYVIWTPLDGLGNRILSLASAFLYALLTNRVLLVDPGSKIPDLFCEPFPEVSWILPSNFPIVGKLKRFDRKSPESYGKLLKKNVDGSLMSSSMPPYLYVHLVHDCDDYDKLFYCEQYQPNLQKVPWLILKSNLYFVPSLFSIPSFQQEINNLFPDLGTVFHHLGRYLFHPTNFVWGLVTNYYDTNLARADEKIGIQIRVFAKDHDPGRFKRVLDQILACVFKENLLPQINETQPVITQSGNFTTKAVLITSLSAGYSEALKYMYWQRSTVTGEVIEIYQPSHEEYQKFFRLLHDTKALAEMYLLSLTDKLVTSGGSTFGYIAQSLGGLKPWILYKPENHAVPDPPYQRAVSIEPCMHAPPYMDCITKERIDINKPVPHIRRCEDSYWGLRFVDRDKDLDPFVNS